MEQELLDNIGNNIGNILVFIIFALIAGKVVTFFLRGILNTMVWVDVANYGLATREPDRGEHGF